MTLLQLSYFQTLAYTLHYTRAAESLHISQPSLSYAISELEKELGVKLFFKDKRKITLTAYGQQFLPYVEKALSLLREGTDVLDRMASNTPLIVRLGYFHSVSASFIPALVEDFYQRQPTQNIRFQFTESSGYDILNSLQSGALDLALTLSQPEWGESVALVRQPLYLVVPNSHHLAEKSSVTFADFAREPQIMLEYSSNLRARMDQLFNRKGIIPNIVFEVRECNAALQYVGLKFGVAVLPQVPAMESEKVKSLPISDQDKEFVRTVYLTWSKMRPISPAAQIVRDHILEHFTLQS